VPILSDGSAVIALSSAGAVRAVPAYTAVGTSKAALESMARHLAVELAPRGIRVNIVSPGSVETEAWDAFPDKAERLTEAQRRSPIGRLVTSEEVALVVQFLCSEASRGIVGQTLVIDGGRRVVE
jgi:enoyl-[acyl-carrier protein] reductase III